MKNRIIELGGFWENIMGGIFIVHMPNYKKDEIGEIVQLLKNE